MANATHYSSMDWRAEIRANERKTRYVIISFVLLYVFVGLLIDFFITQNAYPKASLSQILVALITFRLVPYATLIMGGIAVFSLFIAYTFHDQIMLMGTDSREITPETAQDITEKQLYNVVEEMKVAAGLSFMPKVYIIEAPYMNAFASGFSEKSAMVAITRGLLVKLNREEIAAVMAHELSHIRHHDIKLTLTVAILTNIMLIAVDFLFYSVIFGNRRRDEEGNGNRLALVVIILRYVLPIITVILALFLSRTREFMADAGCVELMRDNQPLASALMKIEKDYEQNAEQYDQVISQTPHEDVRRAAYLFDPVSLGLHQGNLLNSLFSTHPTVEQRLRALGIKFGKD